jgi:serine/threonine protein kinase
MNESNHLSGKPRYSYPPETSWREVGRGAFGVVFHTTITPCCFPVAIKRIPEHAFVFSELRRMQLIRGKSKHVVALIDFWEARGNVYLVMEKLRVFDRKHCCVPIEKVLRETLVGLRDIHALGIIHGDIKPSNIMLDDQGTAKLIDWDDTAYDVRYARSEDPSDRQKRAERDLWAFAATAYEVLVGYVWDKKKTCFPERIGFVKIDFLETAFAVASDPSSAYDKLSNHPLLANA